MLRNYDEVAGDEADLPVNVIVYCGRAASLILFALVALTPILVWRVGSALRSADNDLFEWADDTLAEKKTFNEFCRHFGREDSVIVSWPGCTLDDERLSELAANLEASHQHAYFQRVLTGADLVRDLTSQPFQLSEPRVVDSLVGNMIAPDRQTTCLIAQLSRQGARNRGPAIGAIYAAASEIEGLPAESLRVGGPAVDLWAVTYESMRSPLMLCGVVVVFIAIVSQILLRSVAVSALVIGISIFNGGLSMALVSVFSGGANSVLMPMPALVLVLSVSCCVHIMNYYREAVQTGCRDLERATIAAAWLPCSLSSITSAIGLAALLISKTPPVRQFGLYSAISILLGTALILLVLPRSLTRLTNAEELRKKRLKRNVWVALARRVDRLHWPIVVIGGSLMVFCMLGLPRLDTGLNHVNTFARTTGVMRDAEWLEANVRPLSELNILVVFDQDCPLMPVQRLLLVSRVGEAVVEHPEMKTALSLADLLPRPPRSGRIRAVAQRAILNRLLQREWSSLVTTRYVAEQYGQQYWRISVPIPVLSQTPYLDFINSAKTAGTQVLAAAGNPTGVRIQCTGAVAVFHQIQRQMLRDLIGTYATGFLAITLALCLLLASVRAGLISMVPNLFPAVVVLGTLGWMGFKLDVVSIMTASVALGIAVDDTIHFLMWFRRSVRKSGDRRNAVRKSYFRCGLAMVQTTVICAVGIHFFGYSQFLPTARFGWLVALMLTLALIGDLVLLPAVLLGPAGRFFVGGETSRPQ